MAVPASSSRTGRPRSGGLRASARAHAGVAEHPQARAGDLHDRRVRAGRRARPGQHAERVHGVGHEPVLDPQPVSSALELSSRTAIAPAPRSAVDEASRRGGSTPRTPAIPTELSTVSARRRCAGRRTAAGCRARRSARRPSRGARIARCAASGRGVEAAPRPRARGHAGTPAEVHRADLAADGPDRVERARCSQQRPVGRDARSEQRAHVGGERRGGDDLGAGEVALGHEQEQQVAEVVALVGADEQDAPEKKTLPIEFMKK